MFNADVTLVFSDDLSLQDIIYQLNELFDVKAIPSVGNCGRLIIELNKKEIKEKTNSYL